MPYHTILRRMQSSTCVFIFTSLTPQTPLQFTRRTSPATSAAVGGLLVRLCCCCRWPVQRDSDGKIDSNQIRVDSPSQIESNLRALSVTFSFRFHFRNFLPSSALYFKAKSVQYCKLQNQTRKIQGGLKKRGHRLVTIILSNLNRLKKFTGRFLGKFAVIWILKIPSHFAYVATLPCETLISAKQVIVRLANTLLRRRKCWRQSRSCL